jgi:glycosyltransferase involved in cell wall biosynthesis
VATFIPEATELNPMPTVSVIVTSHNRPRLLAAAIESARAAGKDVEVVVVDDASTDETADTCRKFSDVRYVRVERNQRVAGARNIGILNSSGEFITFLDDDDRRIPGSLDLQSEALAASPTAGLIYAQSLVVDQRGVPTCDYNPKHAPHGDVFRELLCRNFIPCGTALFRRSCLFRVGLLDQSVPGIDDWDLWIRISAHYDVVALEKPVLLWRRSTPASRQGTSYANTLVAMSTRRFHEKWLKLRPRVEVSVEMRREAWRRFSKLMAGHLLLETARALRYGRFLRAQKNMIAALRLHPWGSIRVATSASTFRYMIAMAKEHLFGRRSPTTIENERTTSHEDYHLQGAVSRTD